MMNEPKALKEIHDIRVQIYEETKNMTPGERADHAHYEAQKLIKQYNLKIKYENDEPRRSGSVQVSGAGTTNA